MPQYRVMCIMVGFLAGFDEANRILQRWTRIFRQIRKFRGWIGGRNVHQLKLRAVAVGVSTNG